ncbi:integral membrane protein [Histoplasma capsulatum G186AR]|uniref:Integral membrane protein n=1 Tax=Ajellomyces capsulatus TaxID=5037 RepID=A0A8H8D989_AJECA|nr:integral membrane protein [Histoplasma capsulatum]QSS76409.1 integral membrane protein [Histoplasma capsulatum G186AR]
MAAITPIIPPPPGVTSNFDHPTDVLRTVNLVTQYLTIAVVTIFVATRLIIKYYRYSRFDIEDYATTISWLFFMGYCSCVALLSYHGGGYHAWDVPQPEQREFLKISYAVTILYVPMAFSVKVALLAIVIRIFNPDRKKVLGVYIILGVLLLYYIPAIFLKIFFCIPISGYWEGAASGAKCLNQQNLITADAVISMVSDFAILVLPLPLTWSLHIRKTKKLRVIGILGAGGVATAFSVWRLVIMVEQGASPNFTIVFIRIVLTGNAEAGIGLICACLPVISSFYTYRKKSSSEVHQSPAQSYELSSWQKISANAKFPPRNRDYPNLSPDQAELICTVEAATTQSAVEDSGASNCSRENTMNHGGIHKSVHVVVTGEREKY